MPREHVARVFRQQAGSCGRQGSPLYAALLERIARDIEQDGPSVDAVAGYEDAAVDDVLPLRLLGGAHALALTGRAPELAAHLPSAGGTFDPARPDAAWPALRAALSEERYWLRDWLARPPQTNEVGRSHLLIAALLHTVPTPQTPVRLFELGSSGGLNLRAEQFRYEADGFSWGPPDSAVRLTDTWAPEVPAWLRAGAERHQALRIVERRGCDPSPIDPLSAEGSLTLRAYVWPDQRARMERLEGALRIAAKVPATVQGSGAAEFLSTLDVEPGTWTVVWHSVMRQYVPLEEWAAVESELARLAASATPDAGFAHVAFEPGRHDGGEDFWLSVRVGTGPERLLASAHPHGLPAGGRVPEDPPRWTYGAHDGAE
ncbi:hypothetical protein SAMN06297387_107127 [Streptomyces zhaozhouensis]|uniref:DUF2332 domain-containing protein n=1 Tax=Streptomyces zhaozhouensis TaxID=1300267 RepID=A0A286DVV2_9ACTN|nr:DUF2332 domain-containing protein [Streptomyces zhaozhouensis]SOD62753.1 hypothetical protein SAMN06297387_107127 [Streptomyces zhaozhouensis]